LTGPTEWDEGEALAVIDGMLADRPGHANKKK